MMKINHLAIVLASLTIGACASSHSLPTEPVVYSQAEAADSVRIRVGETIVVEGIKVRFNAVESDSRCPSDVVCVWEGDAVAAFVVQQNCDCDTPAFDLKLHTALQPKTGAAYGFRLELLKLAPYPLSNSTIKQDAYSAWIRLTRES
jgi:hypothetical protein